MAETLRPPIILLGNFRSGTTLLQRLIARHPDTVPLYEPVGLWLYADPGRSDDEFDETDATERVKRYIRKQFLKFQQANGGRRIVEKTPHNILRIPFVRAIFPEARYVYIVRNPLSYISSVELKWQKPAGRKRIMKRLAHTPPTQWHRYFGRFVTQQWEKKVRKRKYLSVWGPRYRGIHDDLKQDGQMAVIARQWARSAEKAQGDLAGFRAGEVLAIRYEDLVREPVEQMRRIYAHVGLEMSDDLAAYIRDEVRADRNLKWQRFEPETLEAIIPEVEGAMRHNGYELPSALN